LDWALTQKVSPSHSSFAPGVFSDPVIIPISECSNFAHCRAGTSFACRTNWIYTNEDKTEGILHREMATMSDLGSGEMFGAYPESTFLLLFFLAQVVVFIQHGKQSHLH
jgi:hypothetical protein